MGNAPASNDTAASGQVEEEQLRVLEGQIWSNVSSLTAAPSLVCSTRPFRLTDPRTTWTHACRPGPSGWLKDFPRSSAPR